MEAFGLADEGSPAAVIEVPTPEPGPGEVRVRVRASSVNGEIEFGSVLGRPVAPVRSVQDRHVPSKHRDGRT